MCANTDGSFECACDPGYQLAMDGASCLGRHLLCVCKKLLSIKIIMHSRFALIDTNECASNNAGCKEDCINTEGSFECVSCKSGYQVAMDGNVNCEGIITVVTAIGTYLPSPLSRTVKRYDYLV